MAELEWVELPPEDARPEYGPPCPGPFIHTWRLSVEEGRASVYSRCESCDDSVTTPVGGEDLFMLPISGALSCHVERVVGEVTVWWEFVPHG